MLLAPDVYNKSYNLKTINLGGNPPTNAKVRKAPNGAFSFILLL